MRRLHLPLLIVLGAAALAVAGCGGDETLARPEKAARLVLDGPPSAVHAGIALADERDFDGAEGVHLTVRPPSASAKPVRQLVSDRATFAVLDLDELARARARGRDVVAVMGLVQRPATGVPTLVLAVSRRTLDDDLPVVRAGVRALRRGYEEALVDPESAISALAALGAEDRVRLTREFDAVAPRFTAGVRRFGDLDRAALRAWARDRTAIDVDRAFAFGY
jgi:ABC-type nitrate/sulfonate/bicarbonate transport system substrate-binding protein